jgi:DNA-binding transcriptional ArsR family regulator
LTIIPAVTDKRLIRRRILELVAVGGKGVARRLSEEFGLSRQAAHSHLRALERDGSIAAEGNTRARRYRLVATHLETKRYPTAGLNEDAVWREVFAPAVVDLPENVRDIWHYGVTEMVNNAIDHSESPTVLVGVRRNTLFTDGFVADQGVGIFLKIQKALGLYDPREAILELAKGKLTTDPKGHTGEGVFFTSKALEHYDIRSGNLLFLHDPQLVDDFLIETGANEQGTVVVMRLANDSPRLLKDIFEEFAAPEEYTFSKTIVPVRLAQYEGEKLVSRSQAKRLTQRFERFRNVVLDFEEVAEIGQAFADELFRVFALAHPDTLLAPTNMAPAVQRVVDRARGAALEQTSGRLRPEPHQGD